MPLSPPPFTSAVFSQHSSSAHVHPLLSRILSPPPPPEPTPPRPATPTITVSPDPTDPGPSEIAESPPPPPLEDDPRLNDSLFFSLLYLSSTYTLELCASITIWIYEKKLMIDARASAVQIVHTWLTTPLCTHTHTVWWSCSTSLTLSLTIDVFRFLSVCLFFRIYIFECFICQFDFFFFIFRFVVCVCRIRLCIFQIISRRS